MIAVNQTLVQVSPHSILIVSDEVKTRAFNLHVGVDDKLLEQTLAVSIGLKMPGRICNLYE
jgi:hypothetical protein